MPLKPNTFIRVTSPSLAPLDEYHHLLTGVWKSGILTHNGPLVQLLEKKLMTYLRIKHLVVVTSGTIGLQMSIKALGLKGEIITTPFTWIATLSAIQWENCTPVFVDIDTETFNIDPAKIEDAVTSKTCAIMGVHAFGNPCAVESIKEIARRHHIKVIYDAAHAMCVKYKESSLLEYGDISATSFHATKIFNTGEGGGCVTRDEELFERLKRLRFFGFDDTKETVDVGFNGKMTEIHAALGLANLTHLDDVLDKREKIFTTYYENLKDTEFIRFQKFDKKAYNYSYMPIVFESEEKLLEVLSKLNNNNIFPKRYFYPSLNILKKIVPYAPTPLSEDLSRRILCLPSYTELKPETIDSICDLITG